MAITTTVSGMRPDWMQARVEEDGGFALDCALAPWSPDGTEGPMRVESGREGVTTAHWNAYKKAALDVLSDRVAHLLGTNLTTHKIVWQAGVLVEVPI